MYNTYDSDFGIENDFRKNLKQSFGILSRLTFLNSSQYFLNKAFA